MRLIALSLLLVGTVIPGMACLVLSSSSEAKENGIQGSMLSYRIGGGDRKTVNIHNSRMASNIANTVWDLFESGNDRFRLTVTHDLLNEIRKKNHVNVIFQSPRATNMSKLGFGQLNVKQLLVALSGKFSWKERQRCVIFFGDPEIGEYNVVINSKPKVDKSQFLKWLQELDAQTQ